MRQQNSNNSNRRPRGRQNSNRGKQQSRNGTFDSNGPAGRIRGNANQIHEKYLQHARDATASGDRIAAESFYQFAEHYFRIMNDSTDPQQGDLNPRPNRQRHNAEAAADESPAKSDEAAVVAAGDGPAEQAADASEDGGKPRRGRVRTRRQPYKGDGSSETGASADGESSTLTLEMSETSKDQEPVVAELPLGGDEPAPEKPKRRTRSKASGDAQEAKPARPRGRPRKNPLPEEKKEEGTAESGPSSTETAEA